MDDDEGLVAAGAKSGGEQLDLALSTAPIAAAVEMQDPQRACRKDRTRVHGVSEKWDAFNHSVRIDWRHIG